MQQCHQFHVHGYAEEGTVTTPFDMTVRNHLDRFHLALDVLRRVPQLNEAADACQLLLQDKLAEHTRYINAHGVDLPEVREWVWTR